MSYPKPALTPTNQPLLDGWSRGELVLQHCTACRSVIFFPREMCPKCWSTALEWRRHVGRGLVVSHSRVYSHVTEPFVHESPVTLAEIELEGGGAMLARIVSVVPAEAGIQNEIRAGAMVDLVPMPEAAKYPLPTFRLV